MANNTNCSDSNGVIFDFHNEDTKAVDFILTVCLSLPLHSVGIFLNLFCYIILTQFRGGAQTTLYLLRLLAAADALYLFTLLLSTNIPSLIRASYPDPTNNIRDSYISVFPYLTSLSNIAFTWVIWMVVVLTLNRFIAVTYPLKASTLITKRRCTLQAVVVGVFGVVVEIGKLFQFEVREWYDCDTNKWHTGPAMTSWMDKYTSWSIVYFILVDTVINLLLPMTIVVFLNIRLAIVLKDATKRMRDRKKGGASPDITRTLVGVATSFTICHFPFVILMVIWSVDRIQDIVSETFLYVSLIVATCLQGIASCINIFIYYFSTKGFRKIVWSVCGCHMTTVERSTEGPRTGRLLNSKHGSNNQSRSPAHITLDVPQTDTLV